MFILGGLQIYSLKTVAMTEMSMRFCHPLCLRRHVFRALRFLIQLNFLSLSLIHDTTQSLETN